MNQSTALYDSTSAVSLIAPWLAEHLPDLEPAVGRRFIQLVTGFLKPAPC
jgi:hypothetical protein